MPEPELCLRRVQDEVTICHNLLSQLELHLACHSCILQQPQLVLPLHHRAPKLPHMLMDCSLGVHPSAPYCDSCFVTKKREKRKKKKAVFYAVPPKRLQQTLGTGGAELIRSLESGACAEQPLDKQLASH